MDFLIPNNLETKSRLLELLQGKKYKQDGDDFYMSEEQAEDISNQLDREELSCDWGTSSISYKI